MAKRKEFSDSPVWRKASSPIPEGFNSKYTCTLQHHIMNYLESNVNTGGL